MPTQQPTSHLSKISTSFLASLCGAVVLVFLTTATPSAGFDSIAPFTDPLRALPDNIDQGVSLPGDTAPVACHDKIGNSGPLTMAEAVDSALCNNPRIKAEWAAIRIQAGLVGEARAAYVPTLSGAVNVMRTRTAYPGSGIATSTVEGETINAALNWRLFDFGTRAGNRRYANSLLVAAMAHHGATLQKTLAEVVQAYSDAQTAGTTLQAKDEMERIARNTLEAAQRREAQGVVGRSDTLQATTALAKASLEKNRAQGAKQKALAVLAYVMGAPANSTLSLADDLQGSEAVDLRQLGDWLHQTRETHPAILSARAQLEAADHKVAATRTEGLPTVDFSAHYYQNGYPGQGMSSKDSQITTLGVSVSWPLFEGFARSYKIRGAEAAVEQRRAALQETEQSTLLEVVRSYAGCDGRLAESSGIGNPAASGAGLPGCFPEEIRQGSCRHS
jgi:outer membrane protein